MTMISNAIMVGARAGGGASEHPGLTLLKAKAIYADFGRLAQDDESVITTNLAAFGTEEAILTPVNSPVVTERLINDKLTKTLTDNTTKCMSLGQSVAPLVNTDFEFWIAVSGVDGRQSSSLQLWGARQLGAVNTRQIFAFITSAGLLQIVYGYAAVRFVWQSTAAVLADVAYGLTVFKAALDFTGDTLVVKKDGVVVPGSFTVSNISSLDPSLFDTTVHPYIGSQNNEGTVLSNDSDNYIHDFALGAISTTDEENLIWEYLTTSKYA